MAAHYDVIVVGLGAMGSSAVHHLAGRGIRVLGLDRFSPPHALGSSHGQTRIIREAYYEDPVYVPLVQRAYELWFDLERQSGRSLLQITGGLMIGPPDSDVVKGSRRSAETHGLKHEILSADEVRRRFPALRPGPEMIALHEHRAGILFPEKCIDTHLLMARQRGAHLHPNETVLAWESTGDKCRVTTDRGSYESGQLLFASGAWLPGLMPELAVPLKVERQVLYWFEPKGNPRNFAADACPIHLWNHGPAEGVAEPDGSSGHFYGFPDLGDGVKIARHHQGEPTDPDAVNRTVSPAEIGEMRDLLERFLPDANGALRSATVCVYTNTVNTNFLMDFLPCRPNVLVASPCSGHGFKFSSAIGEVLADLLVHGKTGLDLSLFQMKSFPGRTA